MIGKKFGKWEVLRELKVNKPGKHYECMCECGTISVKAGTELRAGRGKQCRECQYAQMYDHTKEIGKKYGKWTVIKFVKIHRKLMQYEVECDCGFKKLHVLADLRAGKSTQCTTCHNRLNAQKNTKHGMHNQKIYKVWQSMIHRCTNPNATFYNRYGGRGIKVCDKWLHSFEAFYKDMGVRPEGLTLDRIDNNGNYEPGNCRWISHQENCKNRYYEKKQRRAGGKGEDIKPALQTKK